MFFEEKRNAFIMNFHTDPFVQDCLYYASTSGQRILSLTRNPLNTQPQLVPIQVKPFAFLNQEAF